MNNIFRQGAAARLSNRGGGGLAGLPWSAAHAEPNADSYSLQSGGELDATERVIRTYLLEHPDVIREAMEILKQREAQSAQQAASEALIAHRDELVADPHSPVLGNPKGDVTVVEFFDYRCGYCRQVQPNVEALLATDRNVRLVLKELPILGPESLLAARAALAAHERGKYEEFHSALLAAPQVNESSIEDIAVGIGLDINLLRAGSNDVAVAAAIEKNQQLAHQIGVYGTPAFVIGNQLLPGAVDTQTLAARVAEVRQAKGDSSK